MSETAELPVSPEWDAWVIKNAPRMVKAALAKLSVPNTVQNPRWSKK